MELKQTPNLHRDWIDSHAYGIVKALQRKGHTTYLVGGCVRDLLLGLAPKDFDIATGARPNEVKKIIYNAYVIGKRFRLVLVKRDSQQFEVATFRRNIEESDNLEELPPGDNLFGTPEEDALRRDFTINGMFYDPIKDELLDWTGGIKDLESGVIRMIGEPDVRLQEDPIRILRGIRLAHMIRFSIDPQLKISMSKQAECLMGSALPRRREEWLKFLRLKDPALPFLEAYDLNVLKYTSPLLHKVFEAPEIKDKFLHYLRRQNEMNPKTPVELFGNLVFAYYRATMNEDPLKPVRTKELLENKELHQLVRNELGLFKYEQQIVMKAFHMVHLLNKRAEFTKKKTQRLRSLVCNESFPLALNFAKMDYSLSFEDFQFWVHQFETNSSKTNRSNK